MRVFLDQDIPHNIRRYLKRDHEVVTAIFQGWNELENGNLLKAAEIAGFDVMITADKDYLVYRKRFSDRKIALLLLGNGNWPTIRKYMSKISAEIITSHAGKFIFIDMPLSPKRPYQAKKDEDDDPLS